MRPPAGDPFADLQAMSFPALALSACLAPGARAAFDASYHRPALKKLVHQTEEVLGDRELTVFAVTFPMRSRSSTCCTRRRVSH